MAFETGFVVEDGTGKADATSVVSVADFRAYWTARPLNAGSALTATDGEVQDALMHATRWACSGRNFQGSPVSISQALELPRYWPTIGGRYWGALPAPILEAVCIVARYVLDEPLTDPLERGGAVASEAVGPISTSYFEGAEARKRFAFAEDQLGPFLEGGGAQQELVLS